MRTNFGPRNASDKETYKDYQDRLHTRGRLRTTLYTNIFRSLPQKREGFFILTLLPENGVFNQKTKQKEQNMKVAVVGATGLVGTKMLQVLAERNFPVTELLPVASEKSVGKEVEYKGKQYKIISADDAIAAKPAVAIFSAGGSTSIELAPKFAAAGITVINNSNTWR